MPANDTPATKKWYILKAFLTRYKADDVLSAEMTVRRNTSDALFPALEYYVPHLEEKKRLINGTLKDVSSPLGGYIFLRGTLQDVTRFCQSHSGFNKIKGFDGSSDFLYIRDNDMENFKRVVQAYNANHRNAPFISSNPDFFEQGDTVRIIDGEFSGVQGRFITSRGKDSGYVVVKVGNQFYIPTLEIKSSQLQIVSFADNNHHVYQKLDSYSPVLLRVTERFLKDGFLDCADKDLAKDIAKVERFAVRFGSVEMKSGKMRSRITAYILLSRFVLRRHDGLEDDNIFPFSHYVETVLESRASVTNPVSQAFINAVLYAATGNETYIKAAEQEAASWIKTASISAKTNDDLIEDVKLQLPLKKREVTSYIDLFRKYLRFGIKAVGETDMAVSLPDKTFTSQILLVDILSAFPPEYLERIRSVLGIKPERIQYSSGVKSEVRVTPSSLERIMLKNPDRLYRAVIKTKADAALLDEFLESSPDKYIIRKAGARFFKLQSLGLVATYKHIDNNEWHMLMPDDVRQALRSLN